MKEELVNRKLELEIETLEKQLEEEKKTSLELFNEWIKRWSVTILTFTSIIGGVWGLIIPIKNYYDEQSRKLKYELNGQMVRFVDQLNNDSLQDQAIMMLQYYEMNAFDILAFRLERATNQNKLRLRPAIADAMNSIYLKGHHEVIDQLLELTGRTLRKVKTRAENINESKYRAFLSYVFVLNEIESNPKDSKKIQKEATLLLDEVPESKQEEYKPLTKALESLIDEKSD